MPEEIETTLPALQLKASDCDLATQITLGPWTEMGKKYMWLAVRTKKGTAADEASSFIRWRSPSPQDIFYDKTLQ